MRRRPSSSRALVCATCLMAARRCTDWSTLAGLWRSDGRRFVADSRTRRRTVAHWLGDDARWPRVCAARLSKNWSAAAAPCLDSLRDDGWRLTATKRRCWTTREARWLGTMRAGHATLRAASCAAAVIFLVVAPPSAAAPTSLRRCRDGWFDLF
ncbi:hypothetical protein F511_45838 [Dorcoceras hygrometricum]|uniref:Uncharacterized protein n=1 Tax=Dorcoceras hygrometricum TaxID=472368 RepID=A0A2Z7A2F7_9LAMI|nr:hypothetical protein F511_45838 [Dorcoceras hygrometricum]